MGSDWKIDGAKFSLNVEVPVKESPYIYVAIKRRAKNSENGRSHGICKRCARAKGEDGFKVVRGRARQYQFEMKE